MLKSMTGYGRSEQQNSEWQFVVEIKSVNNRHGDIVTHMPAVLNPFEERIRKILASEVKRGRTDVYIRMASHAKQEIKIDFNLLDAYDKAFYEIRNRYHIHEDLALSHLIRMPDIFSVSKPDSPEQLDKMWSVLEAALKVAAVSFNDMRRAEGKSLAADILSRCTIIEEILQKLKERLPKIAHTYEERLREKITKFLETHSEVSASPETESRILLELAIFTDRIAVDEELVRIASHILQLRTALTEREPVGRKLDFLAQELNREANTIGSKANDTEMSKLVIELKTEIEKIREQVQNVE